MKKLNELISDLKPLEVAGDTSIQIESINFDSTKIAPNSLFLATKGVENDGHLFIKEAVENGAKAVIFQEEQGERIAGVTYIKVNDSRRAIGIVAQSFYDYPTRKFKLVGVTGTNGKTTTATSLFKIFRALGHHVALVSTVENKIDDKSFGVTHTTPLPTSLAAFLDQAAKAGAEYVFMEVSSHGVEEERIAGLEFVGGIFTNLTQDHLDFHGTMENYARAKKGFFDRLPPSAFALSNADDPKGEYMLNETTAKKYFYSMKETSANFIGLGLKNSLEGLELEINGKLIKTKFVGRFNAYNTLAIYGAASLLGVPEEKIISIFKDLEPPAGRLQFIKSSAGIFGIVDYAHTPDALQNILETLNEVKTGGRIISVVGCGGGRDKFKRPMMGEIATKLSDQVIFTSDNPRSEDPASIVNDIVKGVPKNKANYQSIIDRANAIETAVKMAKAGDIVVVAGKGHENYQIFADKTIHFSDLEELNRWL